MRYVIYLAILLSLCLSWTLSALQPEISSANRAVKALVSGQQSEQKQGQQEQTGAEGNTAKNRPKEKQSELIEKQKKRQDFIPSEVISEDLSVSFPVDI